MTRCEAYLDSKGFLRWWSDAALESAIDGPGAAVVAGECGSCSGCRDDEPFRVETPV
jgi:hypothetical protein